MNFQYQEFEIEIYKDIHSISEVWDGFEFRPDHLDSGYLHALQLSSPFQMQFIYVICMRNQQVAAVISFQLQTIDHSSFNSAGSSLLLRAITFLLRFSKLKVLLCGNFFRVDYPAFGFNPTLISWEQIAEISKSISHKTGAAILMIKDLPQEFSDKLDKNPSGYFPFREDLTMKLKIDSGWSNLQDYIEKLSKKYRKRLLKITGKKNEISVSLIPNENLSQYSGEMSSLFEETCAKQFLQIGKVGFDYFVNMADYFGERFFVYGYYYNTRLVAFATHIQYDKALEVHYIGIDYHYNQRFALYFNILYDGLEHAILLRKDWLELGRTAREAKASMGCQPIHFNDFLYVKNPLIKKIVMLYTSRFKESMGEQWLERNPLKEI